MTIRETYYSEATNKTTVIDVTYDLNENPLSERVVSTYDGKPTESKTQMCRKGI